MSILMEKPVFDVKLDMFGPAINVYMNDVIIFRDHSEYIQLKTRFPVNHLMHPKDNNLAMRLFPLDEGSLPAGFRAKISLTVYDHDNPEQEYTVATLDFKAEELETKGIAATLANSTASGRYNSGNGFKEDKQGDIQVHTIETKGRIDQNKGSLFVTLPITVPNSLPLWAFFGGDEIPDYNRKDSDGNFVISEADYNVVKIDLLNEYLKVQDALEATDITPILPMFDERNREVDAAFYLPPGTTAAGIKEAMEKKINNPELDLVPLTLQSVDLSTEKNLKMISLHRGGRTTAVGYDVKGGGSEGFPIMYRKQDGKWILTR